MADRFNCPECKIVKVKFAWNIQLKTIINGKGSNGLVSPLFTSPKIPNNQWMCGLFDKEKILAFHVTQFYPDKLVKLYEDQIMISILIKKGENYHQKRLSLHQTGCQIPKSECQLSADGSCTFYYTILVKVKNDPVSSAHPTSVAINCSNGLSTQLGGLFDSMLFSDVSFNIGGREFPAHKLILATRSQVFADMIQCHSTQENFTNQIKIEEIEPEVFKELLRFIYTGQLSTTTMESMGVGLLIAADKYLLDDLKKECENYLLCKMSPVNCAELLLQENQPSLTEQLKKEAAYSLWRFRDKVMATDKWKMMKQENPKASLCDVQLFMSCFD